MAINVPMPALPLTGLNQAIATGGNLFSQMINPVIKREDMQRQWKQHLDSLALQKAAAGRASAMAPLQLRLAQLQLDAAERDADPAKKMAYIQQIMQGLQGMGGQGGQNGQPNNVFGQPQDDQSSTYGQPPAQQMPAFNGSGMLIPQEAASQAPQAPSPQALQQGFQGFTPEQQMAASMAGLKLPKFEETPAMKDQRSLNLFNQKEAIKASNKATGANSLTNPIKTKYQSVIGGARSALPIIDHIIAETKKGNIPGQAIGALFKRDAQANYKGEISTLLDGIRNAYTIPNTDSGTEKAEDKVLRKSGESDTNYVKRLQMIRQQIVDRESDARMKLSTGNIATQTTPGTDYSHMSDDELRKIAAGGGE